MAFFSGLNARVSAASSAYSGVLFCEEEKGGSFIAAMREKEKPQLLYQKLGHTMVKAIPHK